MKKNRTRSETKKISPVQPQKPIQEQMRSRETARAAKALRSDEAAKLRQELVQLYNQEVSRAPLSKNRNRPSARQSVPQQAHRRNLPSVAELRNSNLSPEVRNLIQDGKQALACERRRARKEVMHALRRTGKAGRSNKRARWTETSHMRCK